MEIIQDNCFNSGKYITNDVDLFFCDPPYFRLNNEWDKQWKTEEEYYNWVRVWVGLMFDQLKLTGTAYVCIQWNRSYKFHEIFLDAGFLIKNRITWKREKGRGAKSNWKSVSEDIFFLTKSKNYTFNVNEVMIKKEIIAPYKNKDGTPKGWFFDDKGNKVRYTYPSNVWMDSVPFWSSKEVRSYAKTKRTPNNLYQKHSTQKPLSLVKRCILASSNENDLICDYFLGSGTTAVACNQLNRKFIGFEIIEEYINITKLRLENEKIPNNLRRIAVDISR